MSDKRRKNSKVGCKKEAAKGKAKKAKAAKEVGRTKQKAHRQRGTEAPPGSAELCGGGWRNLNGSSSSCQR